MLTVVQLSFYVDPASRTPAQMLREWPSLVDVAEAARSGGARVTVVQAARESATITHNGIDYEFIDAGSNATPLARRASFRELIERIGPNIVHVHGLLFPRDVLELSDAFPSLPILIQDHANRMPRFWRRNIVRKSLARAQGVSFCAAEHALPFKAKNMIGPPTRVFVVPESTSRFGPGDKAAARSTTGLFGDPCVLWVGNLNANKDPLCMLEGVSRAVDALPGLKLWCCFAEAPQLRAVHDRIAVDRNLRGRVQLLGRVPHARVELLMQAADLFVSASHEEGSGYALIEALATGLTPVVTDIPSFRALTSDGAVGRLWACGRADALAESLIAAAEVNRSAAQAANVEFFRRHLSFEAVGRLLCDAYRGAIEPAQLDRIHRATAAAGA